MSAKKSYFELAKEAILALKERTGSSVQAIKGYMVEGGIPSTKITGEGRGSSELIVTKCSAVATPASIECNKPNRRVVVTVLVTEQR